MGVCVCVCVHAHVHVCDEMIVERPWLKLETETRVRRARRSLHLLFLSTKGFK